MDTLLAIEEVRFGWPNGAGGLGPVSGAVAAGSWLALIGPNGAGKSTLLKILSGYLKPQAGTVRIGGRDLAAFSPTERARLLAIVPQQLTQPFDLQVRTVVELGRLSRFGLRERLGRNRSGHAEAVERALHLTGTGALSDRRFLELSGGEAQRVLLAMALAQETPILLLDEPTTHLDPGHAHAFMNLLRSLVTEGQKTIVMAYHDLTTVGLYCDHIWALKHGQVALRGRAEALLTDERLGDLYGLEFLALDHPTRRRPVLLFP